jgi:hypothetical protein
MKTPNEQKFTMTDIIVFLKNELESEHGVELSTAKAKDVLIESLLRCALQDQVLDMMLFVADEKKWEDIHYPKECAK